MPPGGFADPGPRCVRAPASAGFDDIGLDNVLREDVTPLKQ
jgi:hypothetical protein